MFQNVCIIGLGLLGGSFALALKKRFPDVRITAVGRSKAKLENARASGMVDAISDDRCESVRDADLIILGTPATYVVPVIKEIAAHVHDTAVITDFASTKEEIVREAEAIPLKGAFVGCHPIAGSEKVGYANAHATLFVDKTIVITPTERTDADAVQRLEELWQTLSAKTLIMDVNEHDNMLAASSHLIHLAATALVGTVHKRAYEQLIYGTGFLDTTRIAQGDETMWLDIVKTNKGAITRALTDYIEELQGMRAMIANAEHEKLYGYLKEEKNFRKQL